MEALFWISALLLVYSYVGYPALIAVWAAMAPDRVRRRPIRPFVTVIVAAHDEADGIGAKLENLLCADYPRDRLEILVGSDGSTDATVERAQAIDDGRIRVFAFAARRGKPAVLNALVPHTHGEILVLADVRQSIDPQAIGALVQPFADPRVGSVSAELVLAAGAGTSQAASGSGFYWRYEKFIRERESRVDSTVGATGALYAVRRSLIEPIPPDTLLDDVAIPLVVIRKGYRVVFESQARAYGRAPASGDEEFTRKVRTIAGNFQLLSRERWLLHPLRNRVWFQTVSHKAVRLLNAPLHLSLLTATLTLAADDALYQGALGAQLLFYSAAATGWALQGRSTRLPIFAVPYMVCLMAWATLVGAVRYFSGRQTVLWDRATATAGR